MPLHKMRPVGQGMSAYGWAVLENIAILAAICLLVWLTGSGWWALLTLFMNIRRDKGVKND